MLSDELVNEIKVAVTQTIDRIVFQHRQRVKDANSEWFRLGPGAPEFDRGSGGGDIGTRVQEPR